MKGRTDPRAAKRGTAAKREPTEIAPVEYSGAITVAQAALLPVPRNLPKTKAVRALFRTICCEVARFELREGDLPLVEALCTAKVRHSQAGAYVRKYGIMIEHPPIWDTETDGDGQEHRVLIFPGAAPTKNPMLKEEREQAVTFDRIAARLGLSPESRIRLNLMQVAGATMLGSLRKALDQALDDELGEIIDGEATEV